jgi:hypothetical protein
MGDYEQNLDGGCAVVLPFIRLDVLELLLIDVPATQIQDQEALRVALLEEVGNRVYRVPIQLLDARGGERHCDYSVCYVRQVQVVPIFLESVFRATNYLSQ